MSRKKTSTNSSQGNHWNASFANRQQQAGKEDSGDVVKKCPCGSRALYKVRV
jgi:hypothetical protein